jgi:signal transduction histidine kinase
MKAQEKQKAELVNELMEMRQRNAELGASLVTLKERQEAEQEALATCGAIIEAFDGLIYVCSSNYEVEFMNERFIERTGYNPIGEKCYRALHDLDEICPWCVNERVQRGETVRWEIQSPKDNRFYYVVNTPVRHRDGTTSKMAMIQDITDRKRDEELLRDRTEALELSNRDLEQFAYAAAHDLREPLIGVGAYLKLLQSRCRESLDADAHKFLSRAIQTTLRMDAIIQSLLSYSLIGKGDRCFEATDCNVVLRNALSDLHSSIKESGTTVTGDALPTVMADASQMLQLFQNLLSNAIKFRGDKPLKIHLGCNQRNGESEFFVKDNGIGIEPPYFDRVFRIFQRLQTGSDRPGAGIGLANCKKIVERHGGRIWVESEPGAGSTFFFTIPERTNES